MLPRTETKKAARLDAGQNAVVRVVAGSLVLYAVLGTMSLGIAAQKSGAQPQEVNDTRQGVRIRRIDPHPFHELLAQGRRMHERGEIKLTDRIELNIEADRNDDGTLSNVSIRQLASQNESLDRLARGFVDALNASRALEVLEETRHLRVAFRLDESKMSVRVLSEAVSAERASQLAQGYGGLVVLGRIAKRGMDEGVVYNNMTVSSSGKQLVFKLEMSRAALGNLLLKQITPN
jgi:hypothetical protein